MTLRLPAGLLRTAITVAIAAAAIVGCTRRVSGSGPLVGTSQTMVVRGTYSRVDLDRVDRLSIEGGKLVLHGSSSTVAIDLPPSADPDQPNRHWTLATEGENDQGRVLTFTHDMSLDDFTIQLPPTEAPIRFGALTGRDGNDVLVLAWGENAQSYHAELTIQAGPGARIK
jgi:hypothetical protein